MDKILLQDNLYMPERFTLLTIDILNKSMAGFKYINDGQLIEIERQLDLAFGKELRKRKLIFE